MYNNEIKYLPPILSGKIKFNGCYMYHEFKK